MTSVGVTVPLSKGQRTNTRQKGLEGRKDLISLIFPASSKDPSSLQGPKSGPRSRFNFQEFFRKLCGLMSGRTSGDVNRTGGGYDLHLTGVWWCASDGGEAATSNEHGVGDAPQTHSDARVRQAVALCADLVRSSSHCVRRHIAVWGSCSRL